MAENEEVTVVPEDKSIDSGTILDAPEEVTLPSDEAPAEETAKEGDPSSTDKETPNENDEVPQAGDFTKDELVSFINDVNANGGEFTEEHYAEMEAKGFSRDQADIYKAGIEAQIGKAQNKLLTDSGTTMDKFNDATAWAKETWDESRVARFNTAIDSADTAQAQLLIESLMDSYNAGNVAPTQDEPVHSGRQTAPANTQGYASQDAMIEDMKDPRYNDMYGAYYKAVREKAARSTF